MFPVSLYEWKMTIAHPILKIMFMNNLRTFEAGMLKILIREYSASAPKLNVLIKKSEWRMLTADEG